jgi:hypothetical protein
MLDTFFMLRYSGFIVIRNAVGSLGEIAAAAWMAKANSSMLQLS